MTSANTGPTRGSEVLAAIVLEQIRQDDRWGQQNHPDGTGPQYAAADEERARTEHAATTGSLTFRHVLAEEVAEAFAEDDPMRLRAELIQVAAVAATWIEAIDRRAPTCTITADPWASSGAAQRPVLVVVDEMTQHTADEMTQAQCTEMVRRAHTAMARRAGEEGR